MFTSVITGVLTGLNAHKVVVETDMNNSLPNVVIVGLPDTAVSEAKERVRSAVKNSGYDFPAKKITVNLAPANIKKEGSGYDLPIAISIIAMTGEMDIEKLKDIAFIGELSLNGELRGITGILPLVSGLKNLGIKEFVVPKQNAYEAALVPDITVYSANNLADVVRHFSVENAENIKMPVVKSNIFDYLKNNSNSILYDFKDVKGQIKAKKGLEIAAAGGHNVIMSGPPGSGKTLLAKCMASILPPFEPDEALEVTKIYSVAGLLDEQHPLIINRPFRPIHHTASSVGIIGGGSNPKPGEITLAHRGILFVDEIVEFPRQVLEVLRQPLEDGEIVISRASTSIKYPAKFILVAAMNPCPCGYYGDKEKKCTCQNYQIQRYRSKISGPLLDRIDIQLEVARLTPEELLNKKTDSESSEKIRQRVIKARKIQYERYKDYGIYTNSELTPKLIKIFCKTDEKTDELLKSAGKNFNLSGRSYDRLLKLARTIADLEEVENIQIQHVAQALQYKNIIDLSAI